MVCNSKFFLVCLTAIKVINWNGKINSINDFVFKSKIKGKIGTFSFKDRRVTQDLDIYKIENKKFIKF